MVLQHLRGGRRLVRAVGVEGSESVWTHRALSLHATDMKYPNMKPIRGISAATRRTSGMTIIHSTSPTAMADRTDTTMLEMIRMLRPAWGQGSKGLR